MPGSEPSTVRGARVQLDDCWSEFCCRHQRDEARAAGWAVIRAQPNSKRRSVAAAWRTVRLVYSQLIKGTCICTACVPILRTPEEISVYVGALHKVACLAAGTNFGR